MKKNSKKDLALASQSNLGAKQIRAEIARLQTEMGQIFNVDPSAIKISSAGKLGRSLH
jgi:hypothetical protein